MKIIRPVQVAQTGTFTRASTGTYWDKNGVLQTALADTLRITYDPSDLTKPPYAMVERASTNISPNSDAMGYGWAANPPFSNQTGAPGPDGNNTAVTWNMGAAGGSGSFFRYNSGNQALVDGSQYVFSFFFRAKTGPAPSFYYGTEVPAVRAFVSNGQYNSGASNAVGGLIACGNGWMRAWMTFTASAAGNRTITIYSTGGAAYSMDCFGGQMELGSYPTSYIPNLGASAITTRSADLLPSPASTNLLTNSEGAVSTLGVSALVTDDVGFNGLQGSVRFPSAPASTAYAYRTFNTVVGTQYTFSVFVKMDDGLPPVVALANSPASAGDFMIVAQADAIATSSAVCPYGNGVYRVAYTFTATTTGQNYGVAKYSALSSRSFVISGFQLEVSPASTGYIKTAGSSVARAAGASTGLVYSNLVENDYAAWSATAVYKTGDRVLDLASHTVYESAVGTTGSTTFIAASAGNVTMKLANGSTFVPAVGTPIVFTGAMPTSVTAGTVYYVQATTASAFSISATLGGAAISTGAQATASTAVASANYNTPISNTTNWLNAGYDNKWSMFDQSVTSQSANATGSVQVVVGPGQRIDSVVGMNVNATKAKVTMTDTVTGSLVYSNTVNLTSNSGITDLFAYFYEPIVRAPDFVLTDLPLGPSSGCLVTVTFEDANSAAVGGLILGQAKDLGITESSAKVGIVDYSVKTQDEFGNYTITPRAFSKKADYTVRMDSDTVDFVYNLLAKYRSTPIVYVGSNDGNGVDQYGSTIVYGFYKDMSIEIAYKTVSVCTLSIEGLT